MSDNGAVAQQANGDAVATTSGDENPSPPPQQTTWQMISGVVFRMVFMYMIMSWFRGSGNKTTDQSVPSQLSNIHAGNIFKFGDNMDMWVFINDQETFAEFDKTDKLFWHQTNIVYGDWTSGPFKDGSHVYEGNLQLSKNVQSNGSFYLHVFFTKNGFVPNQALGEDYDSKYTVYVKKRLNKYKKRIIKKTQNLLTGKTETDPELLKRAETHGSVEVLSHYHPNITINIVADQTAWSKGKVPAPLDKLVIFDPVSHSTYQPILYVNDYWNLLRDYQPLNETVEEINLRVWFQPISLMKLQMYASQGMRNQWFSALGESYADESDEDQDSLKEAMIETNPYLLGLTIVISIVHSVFEFLAFKNDIQFWKSRKSLEGLSVRSIVFGIFQSVVVLLYVLDNDTNFVVRVSIFVGCLIDLWKITKVITISVDWENKLLGIIPRVTFSDKSTYVSATKKYDQRAFKYLGMALFPLLACYAVYSLMYDEHKGFYSYILGMLYGFLLTFGFIMMTPQLFINYKLKSVAHLPWRMLTYKALNTFIDDIFAFVIKMPTMYRIGCFRDDIVFFIYLYQRYIYRVDPKRVNEFGTTGEDHTVNDQSEGAVKGEEAVTDKKND